MTVVAKSPKCECGALHNNTPDKYPALVAQWIRRLGPNEETAGSIPAEGTRFRILPV